MLLPSPADKHRIPTPDRVLEPRTMSTHTETPGASPQAWCPRRGHGQGGSSQSEGAPEARGLRAEPPSTQAVHSAKEIVRDTRYAQVKIWVLTSVLTNDDTWE